MSIAGLSGTDSASRHGIAGQQSGGTQVAVTLGRWPNRSASPCGEPVWQGSFRGAGTISPAPASLKPHNPLARTTSGHKRH